MVNRAYGVVKDGKDTLWAAQAADGTLLSSACRVGVGSMKG